MRQIKFRAWNADAHKMIKPVGILQDNDYTSAIYHDLPNSFTKKRVLFHPTKIDSISLMQYTGINDTEDKEIYEGDILGYKNKHYPSSSGVYLVKWIDEECTFVCERKEPYNFLLPKIWCECKIIGNLFENPKLLENK